MSMRIMNNVSAQFASRQLANTNVRLNNSLAKLSSGYRINSAADDAAGLAISEKFRTQINGLEQAQRNTQDGISLLQTAEGGLEELHSILQRMRVLAVQASNDTLSSSDRNLIYQEVSQLVSEVDRMSTSVGFNGINLLGGSAQASFQATISIHVGANTGQTLSIQMVSFTSASLGVTGGNDLADFGGAGGTIDWTTRAGAESAIGVLDGAINFVSAKRAVIGAMQNRLEHTYNFAGISRENQMAAESRIRDVDFASEMINFTKQQILAQAGNSMLSQANMQPQSVLQLLG